MKESQTMVFGKKVIGALGAGLILVGGLQTTAQATDAPPVGTSDSLAVSALGEFASNQYVSPQWMAPGRNVQRPNTGGTWEYGFWDAHVRSYYTVNRCHGSTVHHSSGRSMRSIDTAAGQRSIAHVWAINGPSSNASYHYRVC